MIPPDDERRHTVDVRRRTAAAYDQIVDEFVRRTSDISEDLVEFRASFAEAVEPRGRVADVGCGPGRDATYFDSVGFRVVGFDASRGMAARASRSGIRMVQADMRMLPIAGGRLDGIWSAASLLHLPRADVPDTLASWRALLRIGGVMGLATSLGDGEGWEPCPYAASRPGDDGDLERWFVHHDAPTLLALLEAAGFDVVSSRESVSNRRWLQVFARRH